MAAGFEEDDPFEAQRERAENPMYRLFDEYGRPNAAQFVVGMTAAFLAVREAVRTPLLATLRSE